MLLRIFKSNSVYNFLLFPVTIFLLLLGSLIQTPQLLPDEIHTVSSPLSLSIFYSGMPGWVSLMINFLLINIICFQLLLINARFNFVQERTFLPAYLFLFIVLALPDLHYVQPVYFSAIFIVQAIKRIFSAYNVPKTHSHAFDAGFLTGMAGLFYFPATLLVLLVPLSMNTIRGKNSWREYAAPLVGLLLPWIFTFSYFFIFRNTGQLFTILSAVWIKREETIMHQVPVQIYFLFLILITFVSSIFILNHYDEKKISTRRCFKILFLYFISSLLLLIFRPVSFEILVILAIPLSFLITNYLTFMRRRFWAELFFTLLVLISVILQFFIE